MKNALKLLFAIASVALLTACGGGGGTNTPVASVLEFNVKAAFSNHFISNYSKNVALTSQNANGAQGSGTVSTFIVPNSNATWYYFESPQCGPINSNFTKVIQNSSIRINNGPTVSATITSHFGADGIPYLYDDLFVHTVGILPINAKIGASGLYLSATSSPRFFTTSSKTCASKTSGDTILISWMLESNSVSSANLKIIETERENYSGITYNTITYLNIDSAGSIISKKYESSDSEDNIILFVQ